MTYSILYTTLLTAMLLADVVQEDEPAGILAKEINQIVIIKTAIMAKQ
jgi:hypothetical protein